MASPGKLMPTWKDRSGVSLSHSRVNLLPKNVAQDPSAAKGPLFEVRSKDYGLPNVLRENITKSQFFQCLYIFKSFEKVVDVIYEKVTHCKPWAAPSQPSSAFCLLVKLFTLRLTQRQVKELLDHGDSTYIRALGALYVRYALPDYDAWTWLSEYADDLEEFEPDDVSTTFGGFVESLFTSSRYYGTALPRMTVADERRVKVQLVLHREMVERGRRNSKRGLPPRRVKAIVNEQWVTVDVKRKIEPYEGAPVETLPQYVVVAESGSSDGEEYTIKLGMMYLPPPREESRRDHETSRRRRRDEYEEEEPREGESVLRGRDILGEVLRRERELAVAPRKKFPCR